MEPLITVIVPVYKVEKYLDRCVESIVNQTYTNLEIILVDDGSPDNCPQMCDAWAQKDNRIKVIHKENGGVSSARNAGIRAANGKYVHFVDSDDWLETTAYEELYNYCFNYDLLVFNAYFDSNNKKRFYKLEGSVIEDSNEIVESLFNDKLAWTNCWSKMFLLKIIKDNDLVFCVNLSYGEDYYYLYNYIKFVNKVVVIDLPLYYYFDNRTDSVTNVKSDNYYKRYLVTEKILKNESVDSFEYNVVLNHLFKEISVVSLELSKIKGKNNIWKEIKEIVNKYYYIYSNNNKVSIRILVLKCLPYIISKYLLKAYYYIRIKGKK